MTSILRDTLLISSPILEAVSQDIASYAWTLMPAALIWALIVEFFGEMGFASTIKRAIFSMLMLTLYFTLHTGVINTSFDLAEKFLEMPKYSSNIFIKLENFKKSRIEVREHEAEKLEKDKKDKKGGVIAKTWGDIIKEIKFLRDDLISGFLWIMVRLCLLFLKFIYSGVYHFAYAFIGIIALIHVFNFGAKSVGSALKSTLWCAMMPWVVAATLIFLGSAYESFRLVDGNSLEELLLLVSVDVFLLFTPVITGKLLSGSGISEIGENLGKMAAGALLSGGTTAIVNRATGWATTKFGNVKNGFDFKSNVIKERNTPSAQEVASRGIFSNPLQGAKSNKEKMILAANHVLNPMRTYQVAKQKKMTAKELVKSGHGNVPMGHADFVKNIQAGKTGAVGAQDVYFKKTAEVRRDREQLIKGKIKNRPTPLAAQQIASRPVPTAPIKSAPINPVRMPPAPLTPKGVAMKSATFNKPHLNKGIFNDRYNNRTVTGQQEESNKQNKPQPIAHIANRPSVRSEKSGGKDLG